MFNNEQSNFKFIALVTVAIFVFSFTSSRAEELSAPANETSATIVDSTIPDNSETPVIADIVSQPETNIADNAGEDVIQVDPIAPEVLSSETPASGEVTAPLDSGISQSEPASSTPIIFDFSQISSSTSVEIPVSPVSHDIITSFIRGLNINKLTILAQWQMADSKAANGQYVGSDDSIEAGAQFLPSGQYNVNRHLAVCALIADNTSFNSAAVKAVINYPTNIAKSEKPEGGKIGCGQLKSQFNLNIINADEANGLVCGQIRNSNNNLLAWQKDGENNYTYSYEQMCGSEGALAKQSAQVYCGETNLSYDDPAGDYKVAISVENNSQVSKAENNFKYLEVTIFENDFSTIEYGPVKMNELKIFTGDSIFGSSTLPTIRNTGNTRLEIKIWQNDFNLGKTNGLWNLEYQAKIGEKANFTTYFPEQVTPIKEWLNLGQSEQMDFTVLIRNFPVNSSDDTAFLGKMTLSADKMPFLTCQ